MERETTTEAASLAQQGLPLQRQHQQQRTQHQQCKLGHEQRTQLHNRHQQLQCRAQPSRQQQEGKRRHLDHGLQLPSDEKLQRSLQRQRSFGDKVSKVAPPVSRKKVLARSKSTPWSLDENGDTTAVQDGKVCIQHLEHSKLPSPLTSACGEETAKAIIPLGARLRRLRSYGCFDRGNSVYPTDYLQSINSGCSRRYATCNSNSAGGIVFTSSHNASPGLTNNSAYTNDHENRSAAGCSSKDTRGCGHGRALFKKSVSFHCTPDLEPATGIGKSHGNVENAQSSVQVPAVPHVPGWKQADQHAGAIRCHGTNTTKDRRGHCAADIRHPNPVSAPFAIGTPQVVYNGESRAECRQLALQHLHTQSHKYVNRQKQNQKMSQNHQTLQQPQQQLQGQLPRGPLEAPRSSEHTAANKVSFELLSTQQELPQEQTTLSQRPSVEHCPAFWHENHCFKTRGLRPGAVHESQHQQHNRKQLEQQRTYIQQHTQKRDAESKVLRTIASLTPAYYPTQAPGSTSSDLYCQRRQQMHCGFLTTGERKRSSYLDPLLQHLLLQAQDKVCVSSHHVYSRSGVSPSLLQQTLLGTPTNFLTDTRESLAGHFYRTGQNITPFSSSSAPQSSVSYSTSSLCSAGESSFCSNDGSKEEQFGTSLSTTVSSYTPSPLVASFQLPSGGGSAVADPPLNYFLMPAPRVPGCSAGFVSKDEGYCVPAPHTSNCGPQGAGHVHKNWQSDVACVPEIVPPLPTEPSGTRDAPAIQENNCGPCASGYKNSGAKTVAQRRAVSDDRSQAAASTCFSDYVAGPRAFDSTTSSTSVGTAAGILYTKPAMSVVFPAGPPCASTNRLQSGTGVPVSPIATPVRMDDNSTKHEGSQRLEGLSEGSGADISSAYAHATQSTAQGKILYRSSSFFFPPKDKRFLRPLGASLAADISTSSSDGAGNKDTDYVAREYEFILPDSLLALSAPLVVPSKAVCTNQTKAAALPPTGSAARLLVPAASGFTVDAIPASPNVEEGRACSAAACVLLKSAGRPNQPGNLLCGAELQKSSECGDALSATAHTCEVDKKKGGYNFRQDQQLAQICQPRPLEERTDRHFDTDTSYTGCTRARPSEAISENYKSRGGVEQPRGEEIMSVSETQGAGATGNSIEEVTLVVQWPQQRGVHNRADISQRDSRAEKEKGKGDRAAQESARKKNAPTDAALHAWLQMRQGKAETPPEIPRNLLRGDDEELRSQFKEEPAAAVVQQQRRAEPLLATRLPRHENTGNANVDMGSDASKRRTEVSLLDAADAEIASERREVALHTGDGSNYLEGRGSYGEEEPLFTAAAVNADQKKDDPRQQGADAVRKVGPTTEQPKDSLASEEFLQLDLHGVQRTADCTSRASYPSSSKLQPSPGKSNDKAEGSQATFDDPLDNLEKISVPHLCHSLEPPANTEGEVNSCKLCDGQAAGSASCSSSSYNPHRADKSYAHGTNDCFGRSGSNMHYYQVLRLLGRGTFGHVYECLQFDACTGEAVAVVAVKVVKNDEAYSRSALLEIAILRQLNSNSCNDCRCTDLITPAARTNGKGSAFLGVNGGAADEETDAVKGDCGNRLGSAQIGEDWVEQPRQVSQQGEQKRSRQGQNQRSGPKRHPDVDLGQKRIVQLLDSFTYRGHKCLVFEILQTDLYQLMKKYRFCGFPLAAVKQICRELLQGLAYLRRMRIVHCDLKPENILVRFSGPLPVQRLCNTGKDGLQHASVSNNVSLVEPSYSSPLSIGEATEVSNPTAAAEEAESVDVQRTRTERGSTGALRYNWKSIFYDATTKSREASLESDPASVGGDALLYTAMTPAAAAAAAAASSSPLKAWATLSAQRGSQLPVRSGSHFAENCDYQGLPHILEQVIACNAKSSTGVPSNEIWTRKTNITSYTSPSPTKCTPTVSLTSRSTVVLSNYASASSPSPKCGHQSDTASVETATNVSAVIRKDNSVNAWSRRVADTSASTTVHASLADTEEKQKNSRGRSSVVVGPIHAAASATAQRRCLSISVKLIDFSSAYTLPSSPQPADAAAVEVLEQRHARYPAAAYLYAQSRFYGAPEAMLGVHCMEKLDIWAVGCVAAELYSGKPLLPGASDFDQMRRLVALRGKPPEWMLRLGRRTSFYFAEELGRFQQPKASDGDEEESRRARQQKNDANSRHEEQQPTRRQCEATKIHVEHHINDLPQGEEQPAPREEKVAHVTPSNRVGEIRRKMARASPLVHTQRCGAFSAVPPGVSKRNAHAWWQRALFAVSTCSIVEKKSTQDKDSGTPTVQEEQHGAGPQMCAAQQQQQKRDGPKTPLTIVSRVHQQEPEIGCRGNATEAEKLQQLQQLGICIQEDETAAVLSVKTKRKQVVGDADANHQRKVTSPPVYHRGSHVLNHSFEACSCGQTSGHRDHSSRVPCLTEPGRRLSREKAITEDAQRQRKTDFFSCDFDVDRGAHIREENEQAKCDDTVEGLKLEDDGDEAEDTLWVAASVEDEDTRERNGSTEFTKSNRHTDAGLDLCCPKTVEWRLKTAQEAGEEIDSRKDTSRASPILRSLQDLLTMRKQREEFWRLHIQEQEATSHKFMRPLQSQSPCCCWPTTSDEKYGRDFPMYRHNPGLEEAEAGGSQPRGSANGKIGNTQEASRDAPYMRRHTQLSARQPVTSIKNPSPKGFTLATLDGEEKGGVEATRPMPCSSVKVAKPGPLVIGGVCSRCCGSAPACGFPNVCKSLDAHASGGLCAGPYHSGVNLPANSLGDGEQKEAPGILNLNQGEHIASTEATPKRKSHNNSKAARRVTRKFSILESQLLQALSKSIGQQDRARQPDTRTGDEKRTCPSRAVVEASPSFVQLAITSATSLVYSKRSSATSVAGAASPPVISASLSTGGVPAGDNGVASATSSLLPAASPSKTEQTDTTSLFSSAAATFSAPEVAAAAVPKALAQVSANPRQSLPERATRFLKKLMKGRTSRPSGVSHPALVRAANYSRSSSSQRTSSYEDDNLLFPKEKTSANLNSALTTPDTIAMQKDSGLCKVTLLTKSPPPGAAAPLVQRIQSAASLKFSGPAMDASSCCSRAIPGAAVAEYLHSPDSSCSPVEGPNAAHPAEASSCGSPLCSPTSTDSPFTGLPVEAGLLSSSDAAGLHSSPPVPYFSCHSNSSPCSPETPVAVLKSAQSPISPLSGTAPDATFSSCSTGSCTGLPSLKRMAAYPPTGSPCSWSAVCRGESSSFPPFPPRGTLLRKNSSIASTATSTSAYSCCSVQHMETALGDTAAVADPTRFALQKQQETETLTRFETCPAPPEDPTRAALEAKAEEERQELLFLDFLDGLLQVDPFERFTAEEALSHPFVAEDSKEYFDIAPDVTAAAAAATEPSGTAAIEPRPTWEAPAYRAKFDAKPESGDSDGFSASGKASTAAGTAVARADVELFSQRLRENAIDEQYSRWSTMRFNEIVQCVRGGPPVPPPSGPLSQKHEAHVTEHEKAMEPRNAATQQDRPMLQTGSNCLNEAGPPAGEQLNRRRAGHRREEQGTKWAADFPCNGDGFGTTAVSTTERSMQQITANCSQQKTLGAPPVTGHRCTLMSDNFSFPNHMDCPLPADASGGSFSGKKLRPSQDASAGDAVSAVVTATASDDSQCRQSSKSSFAWAEEVRKLQDTLLLHHVQNVLEEEVLKARHIREQRELEQKHLKELQTLRRKRQQASLTHQLRSTKTNLASDLREASTACE